MSLWWKNFSHADHRKNLQCHAQNSEKREEVRDARQRLLRQDSKKKSVGTFTYNTCNDNSYDPSEIVLARGGKILFRLYGAAERDATWEKAKRCISDNITGMGGTVEYLTEL